MGFGEPDGEYWLGNLYLHQLTSDGARHRLRIDMLDWSGERTFVQYDNFSVADEEDKFRIHLGEFSGEIGQYVRWFDVDIAGRYRDAAGGVAKTLADLAVGLGGGVASGSFP